MHNTKESKVPPNVEKGKSKLEGISESETKKYNTVGNLKFNINKTLVKKAIVPPRVKRNMKYPQFWLRDDENDKQEKR